jgi:acetyltransferase-like isoleucine patch superfamily enzyme
MEVDTMDPFNYIIYTPEDFKQFYPDATLGPASSIQNPGYIKICSNVTIHHHTSISVTPDYNGKKYNPSIIIGENTIIGPYNSIASINRLEIGKYVLFGPHVHINDHSHGYEDITKPIMCQPAFSKGPVIIEDNCWFGLGCHILSGVTIGKNSAIGANSVVTSDIPPFCVVAGVPAKVIKQYNPKTGKWERKKSFRIFWPF